MGIRYQDVRNDRQWKASTGLSEKQFLELVLEFGKAYENLFGVPMQERQSNSTTESTFKTYEDLLFFTLFSIKSGVTYDVLGLTFGLDGANAYQNQALGRNQRNRSNEAKIPQCRNQPIRYWKKGF